jgi:mRNA-degrading endonuclease RelE of RelBE toxin-antitoxin system
MSYKVKTIDVFEKQAKRLIKKYVSLKTELFQLVQELKENPEQGTAKRIKSHFWGEMKF